MTLQKNSFEAIGTKWDITAVSDDKTWVRTLKEINTRIKEFDLNYSRFNSDSLVSKMNTEAGEYELPADAFKLLNFYKKLYDSTGGLVTPLIGNLISSLGYDADYTFKIKAPVSPKKWNEIISEFNETKIALNEPVLFDFGAAGKGYLVDILGEIIKEAGILEYSINASGDILQRSKLGNSVRIGLQNPTDDRQMIAVTDISNQSLCASSGSKRKWGNYNHIVNPKTKSSPVNILSTWVIADDTLTADGIATGLFFVSPEKLLRNFDFSYAILKSDMSLEYSNNFPIDLLEEQQ